LIVLALACPGDMFVESLAGRILQTPEVWMARTGQGSRGRNIEKPWVGIQRAIHAMNAASGQRVTVERGSGHADQDAEAR
jgi:hypothetical protein